METLKSRKERTAASYICREVLAWNSVESEERERVESYIERGFSDAQFSKRKGPLQTVAILPKRPASQTITVSGKKIQTITVSSDYLLEKILNLIIWKWTLFILMI